MVDNCRGQNKNRTMIFLMIWLVSKGIFKEVQHKLLIKGHTFLACVRDFAQIEKLKRRSRVHTPDDLCSVISKAKFHHPLTPIKMQPTNFLDVITAVDSVISTKRFLCKKNLCLNALLKILQ